MNKVAFFREVRASLFGGKLKPKQVSGMEFILDQWNRTGFTNRQWLAYALATAFHETAFTMQPIREYGRGKGHTYGRPDSITGQTYYGRGYVQLTWKANYEKASRALGIDFVNSPDLVMEPKNAAHIMFRGMAEGWFTGKEFADYINSAQRDYWNARRIINGTDKAGQIADYALRFEAALDAAYDAGIPASDTEPQPTPIPTPIPTPKPQQHWLTSLLLAIWKAFRR